MKPVLAESLQNHLPAPWLLGKQGDRTP